MMFPTREDAAWLLLGFSVFAVAWALVIATLRLAGGRFEPGVVVPLAGLLVLGAAILEIALRRLQVRLTGRPIRPWPVGLVSLSTLATAISPSAVTEASTRVGLNGRVVTTLIYALLALDAIALTILIG